ncbi:AAA family ATPase [Peribacillus sp. SCS-155]|uniref:AAA family ATPase n=1 Tax=Peribacillus sedimenti TaxID=3115297 RepID=UPI003905FA27
MRFDYIRLRAFGHFTDYHIPFDLDKNFHMIYGPNEAGKSTILNSVSHLLYGFPKNSSYAFMHDNKQLRIEGQLAHSTGNKLEFARRKGLKNTALNMDGQPIDEQKISQMLNHLSERQFINMFALDHVRIREGGNSLLKNGGSLGESLFAAASGMNIIRNVLGHLDATAKNLYKKSGSNPTVNQLLKQEKELTKKFSESHLRIKEWKELEKKYHDGERHLEQLQKQIQELQKQQRKLLRMQATMPKIAKLKEFQIRLTELQHISDFPSDILEIYNDNLQTIRTAEKEINKASDKISELNNQLADIHIPENIFEHVLTIDSLYKQVQSYENNLKKKPLLEMEYKSLCEQALNLAKQIDENISSIENIDSYRIPLEQKQTVLDLSKQKPILDHALKNVSAEINNLNIELMNLEEEVQGIKQIPDLGELEAVIEKVKRESKLEEEVAYEQLKADKLDFALKDLVQHLPLWDGSLEALMKLELPMVETVKRYQKDFIRLYNEIQRVDGAIVEEQKLIADNNQRIRELEAHESIPTELELQELRSARDEHWLQIRSRLQGDTDINKKESALDQPLDQAFERSMYKADHASDRMRIQAEKVGEKNKCLGDIKTSEQKLVYLKEKLTELKDEYDNLQNEWAGIWENAQLHPLSPEEMLEWLQKYTKVQELSLQLNEVIVSKQDKENKLSTLKRLFVSVLEKLNLSSQEESLTDLLDHAVKSMSKLQSQINKREHALVKIKQLSNNISRKSSEKENLLLQLSDWNTKWLKAIQKLPVSVDASTSVVLNIIELQERCISINDKIQEKQTEYNSVLASIEDFRDRTDQLLNGSFPQWLDLPHHLAVNKLHNELIKAQGDQKTQDGIEKQIKELQQHITENKRDYDIASAEIEKWMKVAECTESSELQKAISQYHMKLEYITKIQDTEEELLNLGGGMALEQLSQECDGIEYDLISSHLGVIEEKIKSLDEERMSFSKEHGRTQGEYFEKIHGQSDAAVKAEQERESILSQLEFQAEQYITHKLAALLLQKGIEHFRSNNQNPIIHRASEIFARLTLNSYTGITVEFDEKDEPVLMGVQTNGQNVPVEGMSDGTTDQLYLALRISSLEKYMLENEPVPFIVDDILIHFDDERAAETLKVLMELTSKTQVIFFTHHYRLVDLMKQFVHEDSYQLEYISKNSSPAITI